MSKSLPELYSKVPRIACKGLCSISCGPIHFGLREADAMEKAFGGELPKTVDFTCPALTCGTCRIYESRPMICRLWGVVKKMSCPFGCEPERWLSDVEATELLEWAGAHDRDSKGTEPEGFLEELKRGEITLNL